MIASWHRLVHFFLAAILVKEFTATCRSNMELQNLRGLPTTAHIAQLVERPGRIPGGRGFESRCGQIFIFVYRR